MGKVVSIKTMFQNNLEMPQLESWPRFWDAAVRHANSVKQPANCKTAKLARLASPYSETNAWQQPCRQRSACSSHQFIAECI